ncbi:eukaryotic-type DNA primase, catalytic (small) subunit [Candidatus Nitrososphaera evergladensis SR1]|jgi:DNA primase small subunit|uniref:DNA primase small subunit PriS n=1 Tax=Candidatus Nitrososphaera evergladensis SR1 TaxID=1459636 RepID=A0A075MS83_9ARCH|nr:DNA primase small subunit domain-containing protein [Candidatus Nitrososphaera evergladensis]AIF84023.1 eukaryotic-type DNA primase, catalytic (small) subunit [Candidatus Nitrososphaera evergladensis SR1]
MSKGATAAADAVRAAFREYYFRRSKMIEPPSDVEKREFGYMQFGGHGMVRHLSFKSMGELVATLITQVPSDVYCSNALYRFPTLAMQEKQWLGADLIFDIDGKDLQLPCVPSHSYPVCANCGQVSSPLLPDDKEEYACSACGNKKAEHIVIPCAKCIDGSKKEAGRLYEFLTGDLGIDRQNINTYFSGNNGFHFHVQDDAYRPLDSQARSDLVGYLAGVGLLAESVGVRRAPGGGDLAFVKFPRSGLGYGWRKKVADKLKIDTTSTLRLTNIVKEKGGYAGFKAELDTMTRQLGVRIDPQVTTDVHRVFRMPGTLNSKSGLAKVKVSDLESFDPFADACLLGDSKVKIRLKAHAKVRLKGENYNISKETAELPAYAAVYFICKGLAEAQLDNTL